MFKKLTILSMICLAGLATARDTSAQDVVPGKLVRLVEPGAFEAQVGDMVQIDQGCFSDSAPAYRVDGIKVEIKGEGVLSKRATIVKVDPPRVSPTGRPIEGGSSTLQAYIPAEGVGSATVTVTPIGPDGKPKAPKVFTIKVGKPSA